ncbi:hypothetical protein JZ751_016257 [Albula glossodonta]|uniref:Uncharacterized protein n=1 Tax=Albula glossodonta TaxID=121402 RepID=A0A8T2N0R4_9TELE|nr:hypothetical protein JZ751_016257 [Albula glossodonta]
MAGEASPVISVSSLLNDLVRDFISAADRSVSVHLKNCTESHVLINPQVYTYSGYCRNPPQPTVGKGVTEVCSFGHTEGTARGAVGVMTYDIIEDRKNAVQRLAILFSVPFDYASFTNRFAVGFFEVYRACDESMYEEMYHGAETTFTRAEGSGSEISYKDQNFTIRATMSPVKKSIMKVELWDTE